MSNLNIVRILKSKPNAAALISGSPNYADIRGITRFYQTKQGVLVVTSVSGLPASSDKCAQPIFAFHIHEGNKCTGTNEDYFANAMTHYNPYNCPHPYHAGDMPPLFGADGNAFSAFFTKRFNVTDIIGKTVIIHSNPDDFTTQPSGNSKQKIACGIIKYV